jgi:hypothetical protein
MHSVFNRLTPFSQPLLVQFTVHNPMYVLLHRVAAVTRCEPEVECRQQLETTLLQKHDFGGFVRAMRQQFRHIAVAGQ